MPAEDLSDNQLVFSYLKGDEKALEFLIRRYLKPIYNFAYHFVGDRDAAEDVVQETFVKVWKNLKRFNPEKKFKAWLFTIAKNTALDFLRKKKTLSFSSFENERGDNILLENLADKNPLPGGIALTENLNHFLEKLLPGYRTILFLYYNNHFTFREIAEITREPLNTVKSRHRRALIQLKKLI